MCGIAGFMSESLHDADEMTKIATTMTSKIVSRGPDDSGVWTDPTSGLAIGFRRLAIVDLTPLGHQPMFSETGRYVISFNGEIYNFLDLRSELGGRGHRFRGHSDTEVLLAGFMEWGVEETLRRANGMFAFALWDRQERRLWFARDRLGKKPFYYGFCGSTLVWASELKALVQHPDFDRDIDRSSIASFLQLGYIPAPFSIYEGIHKLPPGSFITFRPGSRQAEPRPYWSALDAAADAQNSRFAGSDLEAVDELDRLLRDAVRIRMIADVPLGAFLSGGIDSSTVVALMQAQSSVPVRTFSIGFAQDDFNEAKYAKAVAAHLGTAHTELYVSPEEALAVIPRLPWIYDEPFADSSQIPTFLVSKLARTDVTVALSGDGGDELFGGYGRYFLARRIWSSIGWMPAGARRGAASMMKARLMASAASAASPLMPKSMRMSNPGDKLKKLGEVLAIQSEEDLYNRLVSCWKEPLDIVRGSNGRTAIADTMRGERVSGFVERMMAVDAVTYLPDDILVKVDRASMAVSLECRAPLLDYRVYEFAWRLPLAMKVRGNVGKWIVRQVLSRYVPQTLFERPKMGFGVPLAEWLRGPLRDWAAALLAPDRIDSEGFLAAAPIRKKWDEHLRGERDWHYYLWTVLMFQAWLEHARDTRAEGVPPSALQPAVAGRALAR